VLVNFCFIESYQTNNINICIVLQHFSEWFLVNNVTVIDDNSGSIKNETWSDVGGWQNDTGRAMVSWQTKHNIIITGYLNYVAFEHGFTDLNFYLSLLFEWT